MDKLKNVNKVQTTKYSGYHVEIEMETKFPSKTPVSAKLACFVKFLSSQFGNLAILLEGVIKNKTEIEYTF